MYADIVFQNGNEREFIEMAKKLGYSQVFFIYQFGKPIPEQLQGSAVEVHRGVLAELKNLQKAGRTAHFVLFRGSERQVFERGIAKLAFDIEDTPKADSLHYRNSGFNNVLSQLAHDKNVDIGFSFSSILNSGQRAKLMGRMSQNIRLCRKYEAGMKIASFAKTPYGMR